MRQTSLRSAANRVAQLPATEAVPTRLGLELGLGLGLGLGVKLELGLGFKLGLAAACHRGSPDPASLSATGLCMQHACGT